MAVLLYVMKKILLFLPFFAASALYSQAKQLYDITLSNAKTYTQCSIVYQSADKIKFRGLDKSGKSVEMEVKNSSVLHKKAVSELPKASSENKALPQSPTKETKPEQEDQATSKGEEKDPGSSEKETTEPTVEEPAPRGQEEDQAAKAQDVSMKLREKLAKIDAEMESLTKPSRSLTSLVRSSKNRVENNLKTLDKIALEVDALQKEFNSNAAGFTFDKVSQEDRGRYVKEATAAYNAFLVDTKEKKNSRKVGGLDKFEIMHNKYQGIPEYKMARSKYISTLSLMEKKWSKLLAAEQMRRKSYTSEKRTAITDADNREWDRLAAIMEKEGSDIDHDWFNPSGRNVKMLQRAINKAQEALRREKYDDKEDDCIGKVPEMLDQFWSMMDEARKLMLSGSYDEAEELMKNDENYSRILRLKINLLPNEYRDPLKEQYGELKKEVMKRSRAARSLKTDLERKTQLLERSAENANAQLDAALDRIEQEKSVDMGENTVDINDTSGDEEEEKAADPNRQEGQDDASEAAAQQKENVRDETPSQEATQPKR